MTSKHMHKAALFLLLLCMLCSAALAAPSIVSVNTVGRDSIDGVIRPVDAVTITAIVSNDGDPVDPSKLKLGSDMSFDSCSPSGQNYVCTARFPASGELSFEPQPFTFDVNLVDENNVVLATSSEKVEVDGQKPTARFTSSLSTAALQDVVFSYEIIDTACTGNGCTNCSGIKRLEFFTYNNQVRQVLETRTLNSKQCTNVSDIVISTSRFPNGNTALYVQAYDMFDLVSDTTSLNFAVDNAGPALVQSSFTVMLKGRHLNHFIPNTPIAVDVILQVNDAGFVPSSARADLSELNPSDLSLRNVPGSCMLLGNTTWECRFAVTMNMNSGGIKQMRINATDSSGNTASSIFTRNFAVDQTGPVVTSLTSGSSQFVGSLATFTATFTEQGVGVLPQEMLLNVQGLPIAASSCTQTQCVWNGIMVSSDLSVSIASGSADLLGNLVSPFSQSFTHNANIPVVHSVNISGVGGLSGRQSSFIGVGDRISIVANVTEDTSITSAVADLSAFIANATHEQADSCSNIEGNSFLCTWISDPVSRAASGQIRVNFTDEAGNTAVVSRPLTTYSVSSNSSANHWLSSVSCSPSVLDRQLGTLINQKSYCTVILTPRSSSRSLKTTEITLAGCTGDKQSMLQNAQLFNVKPGSTTPLLKLTLAKNDFKLDELKTTCTLNVFSLIDNSLTAAPEEEQVFVTLRFGNNPLGTIDEAVEKKLEEAMKSVQGLQGTIGTMNSLMNVASNVCRLFNMLFNIVGILYTGTLMLKGTADGCTASTATLWGVPCIPLKVSAEGFCDSKEGSDQAATTGFMQTGKKFCSYVNCEASPWILGDLREFTSSAINKLPGSEAMGPGGLAAQMNPKGSMTTSVLFGCIPGVIENLDKYRQINCLYADCIQTAVKEDNIPLSVCEDLKAEATCKYVMGEVFATVPYTVIFDKYTGMIKQALSDPFSALGAGIGVYCWAACKYKELGSQTVYQTCAGFKTVSKIGEVLKQVRGVMVNGVNPPKRDDYCKRVTDRQNGGESGGFLGLFGGSKSSSK